MVEANKTTENEIKVAGNKIPENLKDSTIKKTKVTSIKKVIQDTLLQLEDLATMEVFMPVQARIRERMKTLKKLSAARSIKIRGYWKTTPPKFHMLNLTPKIINNDEAEITFSVYESDKEGNKKLYEHSTEVTLNDGSKVNRPTSAEYRIAYEVKETIKTGKAITREIMKLNIEE